MRELKAYYDRGALDAVRQGAVIFLTRETAETIDNHLMQFAVLRKVAESRLVRVLRLPGNFYWRCCPRRVIKRPT